VRAKRVRPHLDDKILASWNGLMLGAFARASAVLSEPKYRAAAEKNLQFIQKKLWMTVDGKKSLFHRWRDGESDKAQLLEDHAFLLSGVIELYEATLVSRHLDFAIELADAMLDKFYDSVNGGFWQSTASSTDLIMRLKDDYDGAEPSGNSVAVMSLLKLGAITGRKNFTEASEKTFSLLAEKLENHPQAVPFLLEGLDFSLQDPAHIVIAGKPGAAKFQELLQAAHSVYQPNKVVLGNSGAVEEFSKTLTAKGEATAYVCRNNTCEQPTDDAGQMKKLI
jgi:uncharacterized protein